ncbi:MULTISPECIES: F0F1 ATP synthase subunit B [Salinimicrobium]|jgi:F-type H+-transporting ATPase subunit b|uniref:F0F1 ATP synthase subunit B n=1 Tax=Salinimicrobium TaxID=561367 RepID=UPI001E42208E|nr:MULTISPECIES: F0F1 ATP synthase subunit B [Salinimicrobium]MCC8359576.1 F0F1 ATP synthase subunit B [Salinimicrobium sediminilitoris]MCY2686570.1 F0F1 ATP synthase subunit B [Salinimicrobium sp. TH3]
MEKLVNDFSFGLFFWQIIILVVLIALLRKFAWKPILDALNSREQGIQDALDSAEKARKEMQNLQADNEKLLQEARLERDNMIKEARQIKDKMISEAKEDAQKEGEKMIQQAKATIQTEKNAALADIKNQVATLSVQIAEKVVREELSTKAKQERLVEDMLDDVTLN